MSLYYKKIVEIDTVNGLPLEISVWCTKNKIQPKKTCVYKCDICNKEFDENRKLLLHRNYHKSK